MKATLDAWDERLRGLLARPCGKAARIVCAALTLLGFAGVAATRRIRRNWRAIPFRGRSASPRA